VPEVYLSHPRRSAIGCLGGGFADCPAPDIAASVVQSVIADSGVGVENLDEVLIGNVIGAGLGQNVARQAAVKAGIPVSVPATTFNKVCGSGLRTVISAARSIRCGDASTVLAGGTENMTRAPYLVEPAKEGRRGPGEGEPVDSMMRDGLLDAYDGTHMGRCGDRCARRIEASREEQDDYAVQSYERALEAQAQGRFTAEIVPIRASNGTIDTDEEPDRFDKSKLRSLGPAFGEGGTVTAGNASSVNDGAAAVLVTSLRPDGDGPRARLVAQVSVAREPEWFTLAPVDAIRSLIDRIDWSIEDIDLFEINEAFSCVPMAAIRELGLDRDRVNVHGGAVALGHPIGASGTRILVTLLHALESRQQRRGVAAICIGGGESIAVGVERLS
tara:strand:- start:561 stop:1721 length:1161 start_codon:yes stop_codon:yes gene_type:complete